MIARAHPIAISQIDFRNDRIIVGFTLSYVLRDNATINAFGIICERIGDAIEHHY